MKTSDWQTRRSKFNHDWLKNQYLTALDKFLNILDDRIEDDETEANFVPSVLTAWEGQRAEVKSIVKDFEREMSPETLFSRLPLAACDAETKQWLGKLTHEIWLAKYSVRQNLVAETLSRIDEADAIYNRLRDALDERADATQRDALRSLRPLFAQFRGACFRLAQAIEKFPSGVRF